MTERSLCALNWAGGKSIVASHGTGNWIASLLPNDKQVAYIEPFAGMLGVLLQRPKTTIEIVNDLNSRVVNWWRCLRDDTAELLRLVLMTPNSREEFEYAVGHLDDPDLSPVARAACFTTVVSRGLRSSDTINRSGWRRHLQVKGTGSRKVTTLVDRLSLVADRVCDVQIENTDACRLLERIVDNPDTVIYCDPPYPTADQRLYDREVDYEALTTVLLGQAGRVAISGYTDEWDHLGWIRHEHVTKSSMPGVAETPHRVEVLWTNYDPVSPQKLF